MAKRPVEIVEEPQIVDEHLLIDEFSFRPSQVRRWFTNNIIRRMLSYLVGWTGTRAVMLKATSAGILKVAYTGAGFEDYVSNPSQETHEDWVTPEAVATSEEDFGVNYSSWLIRTKDFEMVCEIDNGTGVYGQKFLLRGDLNEALGQDSVIRKARFSNKDTDGAHDGSYQIMGWK